MAYGSALVDTIQSSTTGTPPQFNDGSGAQIGTLCRAWVNFNGSTAVIRASFNVGSITKNGTGDYTVNFTTALTDANYSVVAMGNNAQVYSNIGSTMTSSAVRVVTYYVGALTDVGTQTVSIHR